MRKSRTYGSVRGGYRKVSVYSIMEAFGMGKDLSKMTLEELWALFPIFLVPHDDRWKDSFNEIRQTLTGLLAAQPVVLGSPISDSSPSTVLIFLERV